MPNSKRSQLLQIGALIVLLIVVALFFYFFSYILTRNVFTLLGTFLVVVGGVGLFRGFSPQVGGSLIAGGIAFILLPMLFKGAVGGLTLAAVLP